MIFFSRYSRFFLGAAAFFLMTSCRPEETNQKPVGGGILTPLTESTSTDIQGGYGSGTSLQEPILPLVNPGEDYNILSILDGNLDSEPSDEQVLVAMPLDDEEAPLEIMIASTNPIRNQYAVVWSMPLIVRTLTGITLRSEDMTGNGRSDLIVAGFDENGSHVTEVFAVSKNGEIDDFLRVFSLTVNGNIDIVTTERSPAYWSGISAGEPFNIIVQKTDPDSDNAMDIIETDWVWNAAAFAFQQGETRRVEAQTILEERIARVYGGDVEVYEQYLAGAWYRESGSGAFEDMLFFDPRAREIIFYDGSIQEVFAWGQSHRTTAKRLYTRVNNAVIPSMFDTVSVSAESWENIDLWRAEPNWNGSYRRLGAALQNVLDSESKLAPITDPLPLSGVWRSSGGTEIIFDLPGVQWTEDEKTRSGTASLFRLNDTMVLQIRFMKKNGALEERVNWAAEYEEAEDDVRIIRTLSLSPARLTVDGIRTVGGSWRRFEQIEVVSPE
jgi:hypothetical protein